MEDGAKRLTLLYHHRTRSRDGQSVHIDEMIHALRGLGHKIIVIEPRRVEATAESIERRLLPPIIYEILELGYSLLEFAKLSAAAIVHRPDALYERANLFMLSGLWTCRLFRFPYLLEVNSPLADERARYDGLFWQKLAAWTEQTCWRAASVVLPVTEVLASIMRRNGVSSERIVVTPNGVNPKMFFSQDSSAAKLKLGLKNRLVLGFVGYVREWHGLDRVIHLLATHNEMKNAYFLIVGDGPARSSLEKQAARLGVSDRIRFTGAMPREALPNLIAAFDVALQPQVTSYASPLKLFEYMAQGRTIVAPASSNIQEILKDKTDALLYAPDSDIEFAEAIEQLVRNPELRERLGQAAAQKIVDRNLTWEGNARRVVSLTESFAK
jgi:glycosyltransferase involved in cell wall biosynthesis